MTNPTKPCTGTTQTGERCRNSTSHPTGWCGQCANPPGGIVVPGAAGSRAAAAGPGPDPLSVSAVDPPPDPGDASDASDASAATADAIADLVGVFRCDRGSFVGTYNAWSGQLAACDICGCLFSYDGDYIDRYAMSDRTGGGCDEQCGCHSIPKEVPAALKEAAGAHTSPERLAEIAADPIEVDAAARAVANPNLPADLIVSYLNGSGLRRLAAASNPSCPTGELLRLLNSFPTVEGPDGLLFLVVSENPAATDEVLAVVAAANPLLWAETVTHANAGPLTLAAVAANSSPSARLAVAVRGDTPPDVLERLAGDPDDKVRAAVAANEAAPTAARSHAGLLAG